MIDDSVPWMLELSKLTERLERRRTQKRWSGRASFEVERDLMIGMFAIRRLIESEKSSSLLPDRKVSVLVCKLTGPEPFTIDLWRPLNQYAFDSKQRSELPVSKLVHEFIHSFILMMSVESGGVSGVYVGSDRTKRRHVYFMSIQDVIELFRYVATEDVVSYRGSISDGAYESERISNHDVDEGGAPDWKVEDMEARLHEALLHVLGDPPCPVCLTTMEISGESGRERWECPACGAVKLA